MKYYTYFDKDKKEFLEQGYDFRQYLIGEGIYPGPSWSKSIDIWEVEPIDILEYSRKSFDDYKVFKCKSVKLIRKLSIDEVNDTIPNVKLDKHGNVVHSEYKFECDESDYSYENGIYTVIDKRAYDENMNQILDYKEEINPHGRRYMLTHMEYEFNDQGKIIYVKNHITRHEEWKYHDFSPLILNFDRRQMNFIVDNYERIKRDKERK
jgi:hypothetical protein